MRMIRSPLTETISIFLFFVILSLVLINYCTYSGPIFSDDTQYINGAYALMYGGEGTVGGARLTLTVPLLISLFLADFEIHSAITLFSSLFLTLLSFSTFLLARCFVGVFLSLLVTMTTVTSGAILVYSGVVLPDVALAAFYTFFIYHLIKGVSFSGIPQDKNIFLAGLFAGLCFATKEASSIFIFATMLILYWLVRARGFLNYFYLVGRFSIGVFIVVFLDMFLVWYFFEDPVVRINNAVERGVFEKVSSMMAYQGEYPHHRIKYAFWAIGKEVLLFLPLFIAPSVHIISQLVRRQLNNTFAFLYGSLLLVFIYLSIGSVSVQQYIGIPIQPRYYSLILPLLFTLNAIMFEKYLKQVFVLGLFSSLFTASLFKFYGTTDVYQSIAFRDLTTLSEVHDCDNASVYLTSMLLERFKSYRVEHCFNEYIEGQVAIDNDKNSYLVVEPSYFKSKDLYDGFEKTNQYALKHLEVFEYTGIKL